MDNQTTVEKVVPINSLETNSILQAIKKVIEEGGVTSLRVDIAEGNCIRYSRVATDKEVTELNTGLSYHDVSRHKPMEECLFEEDNVYKLLFNMFDIIEDSGFSPIILLFGMPLTKLKSGLNLSRRARSVFGVNMEFEGSLPDDCVILCGGRLNGGRSPEDVCFSVVAHLP